MLKQISIFLILLGIISCKEEIKKDMHKLSDVNKPIDTQVNIFKKNYDTILVNKPIRNDSAKFEIPPKPTLRVSEIRIEPIKCFNPNLNFNSAIELINSGTENTQWFIVERKEVDFQHTKLDETDTIYLKNELIKLDWKQIDSSNTSIGNQNKISLRLEKDGRICNIKKILWKSNNKSDNQIEETFQIRKK